LLLDGGFLREAQERLQKLQSESQTDTELMFAMVRLNLMLRRREKAGEWTEVLKRSSPEANTLVQLGRIYEDGRQQEHAAALYTEALSRGHYPEAHLGLGRLAAGKNKEQARRHLISALDLSRQPGEGGAGSLQVFQHALG